MGVEQARWGCVCGPDLEAGLDTVDGVHRVYEKRQVEMVS